MIYAVIPVKPLGSAKSRLAHLLSPGERRDLALAMLADVLAAVRAAPAVAQVSVVSRDPAAIALAAEHGASALFDHTNDLNAALSGAAAQVAAAGGPALLVLPSDLPLVSADDIGQLVDALGDPPSAVIAPSPDGGTNALLVAPPGALPFHFGPDSLARHMAAAQNSGLAIRLVRTPGLDLDVDRPDDLLRLSASQVGGAALRVVRALNLETRVACA